MILFGIDIRIYFLLFLSYAVLGWILEVVGKLIEKKKFVNRGFLIGPYCPIYGVGAILITSLLQKYLSDPLVLFIMAIIICGTLEYLTSYIMEKIFHARWWDYSQRKFNINGRVCLYTIIPFGILGMTIMYVLNPILLNIINSIPDILLNILSVILLVAFTIDIIVSTKVIGYVGRTTREIGKQLDNTEEITEKVKEILSSKSGIYRRLLKAFPSVQTIKIKLKEKQKEIKKQINEQKEDIKNNINKQKKQIQEKISKIGNNDNE